MTEEAAREVYLRQQTLRAQLFGVEFNKRGEAEGVPGCEGHAKQRKLFDKAIANPDRIGKSLLFELCDFMSVVIRTSWPAIWEKHKADAMGQ